MENQNRNSVYAMIVEAQLKKLEQMITAPIERNEIKLVFSKNTDMGLFFTPSRFVTGEACGLEYLLPEVEEELLKAGYIIKQCDTNQEGWELTEIVISWKGCSDNKDESYEKSSRSNIILACNVENAKIENNYQQVIDKFKSTDYLNPCIVLNDHIMLKGLKEKLLSDNFFVYEFKDFCMVSVCDMKNLVPQ